MVGDMHMAIAAPGLVRCGLFGLTSVQNRKLLRATPVPGTITPLPKAEPKLWVMQTRLPSGSAIENEVVCAGSSLGCGIHCSVGPLIGRPSRMRSLKAFTWL